MGLNLPELPSARFVRAGDYKIAYFVCGPENGRPLVLCHGLAASGLQFVGDADYFAAQGYYVIVPDLRGHGRSTCPQQRTDQDFSIVRLAADMVGILDKENITATDWVGNSLGGILALSLMKTDGARLKKFVSFGTAYSLDVPDFAVRALLLLQKVLGKEMLARIAGPLTTKNREARAIVSAMIRTSDLDAVARITRNLAKYDLVSNALGFDGPILMIQGELDRQINQALQKALPPMLAQPNFKRVELKGAGHCANLDQPEKTRFVISEFLGS